MAVSAWLPPTRDLQRSCRVSTRHYWRGQGTNGFISHLPPGISAGQTTRYSRLQVSADPPTKRCPSCIGHSLDRASFCTIQYETATKPEKLVTSRSLKHSREAMHITTALLDASPWELLPPLRLSRPSRLPGSHSAILKGALETTPSRTVSARVPQVLGLAPSIHYYASAMPHYMHPHSVGTKASSGPHHG